MRKFAFLVATVGSTAAWYILSNKKLRGELGHAKNPDETVEILTRHLGRDASKIGGAVHEWIHSEEVQQGLTKAKEFTESTFASAKRGLSAFFGPPEEPSEQKTKPAKSKGTKKTK